MNPFFIARYTSIYY